jgi:hypothetical protein
MASYILDKAYAVNETKGVDAYVVVVQGPAAGECRLPYEANEGKILGVTVHCQSLQGSFVTVRKAGIARVIADCAIEPGDAVCTAPGRTGRVIRADVFPGGTKINCLGFAETLAEKPGDVIEVFISLHQRIERKERTMAKYRKKPIVIEAVQWHGFVTGPHDLGIMPLSPNRPGMGWMRTLEGELEVTPGDWIITGVKGEKYPCKADVFALTYEAVE